MIYIITGPSGVGKNTIINELSNHLDFYFSVSHTTRPRRENEVNGKDYYFITEEEFENLIKSDQMIEYEQYGDFYLDLMTVNDQLLMPQSDDYHLLCIYPN
jgi:guanylate kinase